MSTTDQKTNNRQAVPLRAFFALPVEDLYRHKLIQLQSLLPQKGFRVTPPSKLHLTLVFLGDTPKHQIDKLCEKASLLQLPEPPTLTLERITPFPSRSAKLIAATVHPCPELNALHQQLSYLLSQLGITADQKPFRPHITLGRYRHTPEASPELSISENVKVNKVALYHSTLSQQDSTYHALWEFDLTTQNIIERL